MIAAVWMGTPCSSWSRARDHGPGPPPLRSDQHVLGLPGLSPKCQASVDVGNALMKFTASIMDLCKSVKVPFGVENPHRSRLWLAPAMIKASRGCLHTVTDVCQWGQPFRKRTTFISCNVDLGALSRLCQGKHGICSRSGAHHIQLSGLAPDGRFLTAIAEPYPTRMCSAIAKCFHNALAIRGMKNLKRLIN